MRFLRSSEWRSHSKVGEDAIGHLRVSKARCEAERYATWWPTTEDRNFQSRSAANAVLLLF